MGWDTASSGGMRADWNAGFVWGAAPATARQMGQPGVMPLGDKYWNIFAAAAVGAIDKSGPECSGIIHTVNRILPLARLVMDGGGGGQMVKKELWRSTQLIDGALQTGVTGLCDWGLAHQFPGCRGIIQEFTPNAPRIRHVWDDNFAASFDGIIENMHRMMRSAFENRTLLWPMTMQERGPAHTARWERRRREMLAWMDVAYSQFGTVRFRTEKDGRPHMTRNGFHSFEAKGRRKKDFAYAACYGFIALISLLTDPDFADDDGGDDDGAGVFG